MERPSSYAQKGVSQNYRFLSTFVSLMVFNLSSAGVLSADDESQRRLKYVYPGWKPEFAKISKGSQPPLSRKPPPKKPKAPPPPKGAQHNAPPANPQFVFDQRPAICYYSDPSGGILQLIHHTRLDRVPLMTLYSSFFAGQLYFLTLDSKTTHIHNPQEWAKHDVLLCQFSMFYYEPCIGRLFSSLSGPSFYSDNLPRGTECTARVPVKGVLYHHMDMFVNPLRLLKYDQSLAWFPAQGIGPTKCLKGGELQNEHEWGWWRNSKEKALKAVQSMYASPDPPRNWENGRVCKGHVDLWYLPVTKMAVFSRYASFFSDVMHEVGISTLLFMTIEGSQWLDTNCHGSCCNDAGVDFNNMNCGHRIEFENQGVQLAFALYLADEREAEYNQNLKTLTVVNTRG